MSAQTRSIIDGCLAVHLDEQGWVTIMTDIRGTVGMPPDAWDRIVAAVEDMRRGTGASP